MSGNCSILAGSPIDIQAAADSASTAPYLGVTKADSAPTSCAMVAPVCRCRSAISTYVAIDRDHGLLHRRRKAGTAKDDLITRGVDNGSTTEVAIELIWVHSALSLLGQGRQQAVEVLMIIIH